MSEPLYQIMGRHRAEPLPDRKPSWLKVKAPGGANYSRLRHLIRELDHFPVVDSATGLSAEELAGCVLRTLALPDIAALLPGLLPEFPVYAAHSVDGAEAVTVGIADALTLKSEDRPSVVVDWKSDVALDPQTLDHYRAQIRAYIDMTGAERGLIVLMTTGVAIAVQPTKPISPS